MSSLTSKITEGSNETLGIKSSQEQEKVKIVEFDGDDDPIDPKNYSNFKKWAIVIAVTVGATIVTCASSLYVRLLKLSLMKVACYQQIEEEFHVSQILAILGLTTFVLGLAIGPLFMGPLSEFFGRKPVYIVSYLFFISTFHPAQLT